MSGLFGGGNSEKYQKGQQTYIKNQQNKTNDRLDKSTKQSVNLLMDQKDALAKNTVPTYNSSSNAYNLSTGTDSSGSAFGKVERTAETQGWMDKLAAGLASTDDQYNELLSQIKPGFGKLSEATQEQLRNAYAQRFGDLKDQLARRRVLGSSFANADMDRLNLEREQQMKLALAETTTKELEMTQNVIKAQAENRSQTISTALSQMQYEGNLGINLTNMVLQSMNENTQAQTDLVKLAAQVKMQGATASANTSTSLGNTGAGSYTEFSSQKSSEDAAPWETLATLAGSYIGKKA